MNKDEIEIAAFEFVDGFASEIDNLYNLYANSHLITETTIKIDVDDFLGQFDFVGNQVKIFLTALSNELKDQYKFRANINRIGTVFKFEFKIE